MKWATVWVLAAVVAVWAAGEGLAAPALESVPESPAPGEAFWIRVDGVSAQGPVEARFGEKTFALWPEGTGWAGIAVVDRDDSAGSRDVLLIDRASESDSLIGIFEIRLGSRDYGTQNIAVDDTKVTLSPENQERVDRENAAIRAVLDRRSAERLWLPPIVRPAEGETTGPFGVRRVYNGKPRGYHNGVDISAPQGAPVTAAAAGRVALVGDYFLTGKTVVLDHGLGFQTIYMHMDSVAVVEGEAVEPGTIVGLVGSTGRSTGPHLHWGTYVSGVRADPDSLLRIGAGLPLRSGPSSPPPDRRKEMP